MQPTIHPKLSHLPADRIADLVAAYRNGAKVADLCAAYGIDARPADLRKILPPTVRTDLPCPYCDIPMWQPVPPKTAYSQADAIRCPACQHQHQGSTHQRCSCKNCLQKMAERDRSIAETKRKLIADAYPTAQLWPDPNIAGLIDQLTLKDAVYLLAFYRYGHFTADATVGPPYSSERPLAPTGEYAKAVIDHLYGRGIIRVSPQSPIDAFQFDTELTKVDAHFIYKVRYRVLPMLPAGMVAGALTQMEIDAGAGAWSLIDEADVTAALQLWQTLALNECLEAFFHQADLHGLPAPSGDKTVTTFKVLLEHYSVAQVYNFVWAAARDAAAYYQRGGITKSQAGNSMVGNCRTRADRARLEGWTIKPYGRNYDRPRSHLSHVLHDVFFQIGEIGFTAKPERAAITAPPVEVA